MKLMLHAVIPTMWLLHDERKRKVSPASDAQAANGTTLRDTRLMQGKDSNSLCVYDFSPYVEDVLVISSRCAALSWS
jgi:hypothetical protein